MDKENVNILENRLLVYIDVLGTRNAVAEEQKLETIIDIFNFFSKSNKKFQINYKEHVDNDKTWHKISSFIPEISSFSDHIVASYPAFYDKEPFDYAGATTLSNLFILSMINFCGDIYRYSLERGMLVRGVITYGKLYHNGNIIFGSALNEAVKLEESIVIFPRIIVTEKLIRFLSELSFDFNFNFSFENDFDGIIFIDYLKHPSCVGFKDCLAHNFSQIRKCIEENIKLIDRENNIRELVKWEWLANKFNDAIEHFSKKYKIKEIKNIKQIK